MQTIVKARLITMKKTGRPLLDIPEDKVEYLASLMCTAQEIAGFFDCDKSTILTRFPLALSKGREKGKVSLRKKQFKMADRSAAMCIFLGKNYLDQKDKYEGEGFGDTINVTPTRTFIFQDIDYKGTDRGIHALEGSESNRCKEEIQDT